MATEARKLARPRKRIGPYRIVAELGSGGMGVVWHAVHEVLDREVAIKELFGKNAKEKEAVERFRREGMALAQLKHESIVGIHDLFLSADKLYMVLEYVPGVTLGAILKESGALPWDVVAIIGMRLASALEHAHYHQVIHRDLKPGNVMLSRTGEVKLMDFGIARDQMLGNLTQTGFAVGTPAYMAPEAISGAKGDAQSDLYSLGVTMYELCAGKNPFLEVDPGKTFTTILSGKWAPLKRVAEGVPRPLRKIIERCMRVEPRKRYESAADLRRELELFLVDCRARANHRARIVGYLRQSGRISETEALTCINANELIETTAREAKAPGHAKLWLAAATLLAALGGAGWWAWMQPGWMALLIP